MTASKANPRPAAILLAGGRSRRYGTSKAWLLWQGQPLLSRLLAEVRVIAEPAWVVAQRDQDLPSHPGAIRLSDQIADAGPLHGLAVGLSAARAAGATRAWVLAVDYPFLTRDILACLQAQARPGVALVPRLAGQLHPLVGLYPVSWVDHAEEALAQGEARVQAWLNRIPREQLDVLDIPPEPAPRWLINVNQPTDWPADARPDSA